MLTPSVQFDLAVIGGGPAGSSAAITGARLGARVVLLEAKGFPRHRVCGEFVSGEALGVLAGLLADTTSPEPFFDGAPVMDRMRLFWGGGVIEAPVQPAALSITRYDLDARLWKAAQECGIETRANCDVLAAGGEGPFFLETSQGKIAAKALIIAAGRWSQFTRDRAMPPGPKWIGVKGHFHESNPSPSTDLYFFENGYCGVQAVAKDMVNACAMVRSDTATTLPEVFRLHAGLAQRVAGWTPVSQSVSTAPLIYRTAQPIRDNVLFVGDAAAFIDPFVGDGISIALRSGRVAAECVCRFLAGELPLNQAATQYEREYSRQFAPLLSAASRVRCLMSLPLAGKIVAFKMLRVPGLIPFVIRKTRHAG